MFVLRIHSLYHIHYTDHGQGDIPFSSANQFHKFLKKVVLNISIVIIKLKLITINI